MSGPKHLHVSCQSPKMGYPGHDSRASFRGNYSSSRLMLTDSGRIAALALDARLWTEDAKGNPPSQLKRHGAPSGWIAMPKPRAKESAARRCCSASTPAARSGEVARIRANTSRDSLPVRPAMKWSRNARELLASYRCQNHPGVRRTAVVPIQPIDGVLSAEYLPLPRGERQRRQKFNRISGRFAFGRASYDQHPIEG